MATETNISSHINDLKLLTIQWVEVSVKEEDEDAKDVLLSSYLQASSYCNVIFTLSQMSSKSLDNMLSSLLPEDRRLNEEDPENTLLTRNRIGRKT
jgi:hypothetical protein